MEANFSYESAFSAAQRIDWKIEDIIAEGKQLDFSKAFLPEELARVEALDFLNNEEKRMLNQIRGYGYLHLFGVFEEMILPFVLDHMRQKGGDDDHRTRAYLQFASEEAKHIHLFRKFREAFKDGFGGDCPAINPTKTWARDLRSMPPLAMALLILHFEWMTQKHYVERCFDDSSIDPLFKSLLYHHWMEEVQHAKIDALMIKEMAADLCPKKITSGLEGYLSLIETLDEDLSRQAALDLETLHRTMGRKLPPNQMDILIHHQHQALRWTFIGSGMSHDRFLGLAEEIQTGSRTRFLNKATPFL